MDFLQGLSGVSYLALLFCIAGILDLLVTLHYRAISLNLISRAVVLSGAINVISMLVVGYVILAKDPWPLVADTAGVMLGTWAGMRLRFKK